MSTEKEKKIQRKFQGKTRKKKMIVITDERDV